MAKRVLVADDDPDMRDLVSQYLTDEGIEVLQAGNGLEALLQVKHGNVDSVILDIQMPRLGGLDALKRIRGFSKSIKVVIVSGSLDDETRERAKAGGAAGVFDKPVALTDLLSAIGGPPQPAVLATPSPPVVDTRPAQVPPPPPPASPAGATSVLVVDDDPDIRDFLSDLLSGGGYVVRTAQDGTHAVREITAAPPDVILLDIEMPGLSGVDALPTLRALAPRASVIMVSGSTDAELSKLALARGAFDYVTKPIDYAYLSQSIESAMAMRGLEG